MSNILIIEKSGVIKETLLKSFSKDELYKKAGFKNSDGFKYQHKWTLEINGKITTISLFGKTTGRAGQENKYDFPPPVDTILFFGACILVANISEDETSCENLKTDLWENCYEILFGGFEDVGDEDSEESEDDIDLDIPRTKDGYVKDGFIVDDEDNTEIEDEDEEDGIYEPDDEDYIDEIDEIPINKPSPKKLSKEVKKRGKSKLTVFDKIDTIVLSPEDTNQFLDCTSELVEEEYE